ncbi:MAG: NAD(P)-dependent oxidoreductase [Bacteroidota bacterium]
MRIVQLEPIGIKENYKESISRQFEEMGHEVIFHETKPETEDEKIQRAKDVEGIEMMSFKEVMQKSDIISIHTPLTEETKGMIGKEEFELMKNDAVLINTARGPIVDYSELAEALTAKTIAGAAVDVYEKEPPIDSNHPLLSAPNTLLLPHLGFATAEAIEKRSKIIVDNITKWLNGNPQNVM